MLNDSSFVEFMLHYPKACINSDTYSPWQLYGNIPATDNLRARLYPQLKAMTDTMPDITDRVELLHKLCQAFPYGYDDEIWGEDFPFCAEQSWFYPESDCEDHAIHFSRLVRDILNLDCILVYISGKNGAHMIAAVTMPEGFEGAYTEYDGKKYFFAEPTGGSSRIGRMWDNDLYDKSVIIPLH